MATTNPIILQRRFSSAGSSSTPTEIATIALAENQLGIDTSTNLLWFHPKGADAVVVSGSGTTPDNMATTNTAQTISAVKTFTKEPLLALDTQKTGVPSDTTGKNLATEAQVLAQSALDAKLADDNTFAGTNTFTKELVVPSKPDFPTNPSDTSIATEGQLDDVMTKLEQEIADAKTQTLQFKGYIAATAPTTANEGEMWYEGMDFPPADSTVSVWTSGAWVAGTSYSPANFHVWQKVAYSSEWYYIGQSWNQLDFGSDGVDNVSIGFDSDGKLEIKTTGVTNEKLANNAVSSEKIQDGAVTSAKIADGAVETTALASYSVTNIKLANIAGNSVKGNLGSESAQAQDVLLTGGGTDGVATAGIDTVATKLQDPGASPTSQYLLGAMDSRMAGLLVKPSSGSLSKGTILANMIDNDTGVLTIDQGEYTSAST